MRAISLHKQFEVLRLILSANRPKVDCSVSVNVPAAFNSSSDWFRVIGGHPTTFDLNCHCLSCASRKSYRCRRPTSPWASTQLICCFSTLPAAVRRLRRSKKKRFWSNEGNDCPNQARTQNDWQPTLACLYGDTDSSDFCSAFLLELKCNADVDKIGLFNCRNVLTNNERDFYVAFRTKSRYSVENL